MGTKSAEDMSSIIETFVGNRITRAFLRFCTSECKRCGERVEISLRNYFDHDVIMCLRCKISYYIIKSVLDRVVGSMGVSKKEIEDGLKDPMWIKGLSSVLRGIAKYGVQRPFISYSPFLVVWNVTKVCNLHCRHCYESAGAPPKDELTTEDALITIDKLADAGIAYIALSGGEPLMRKDFWEIAQRIRDKNIAFSIATNGTLITKDVAKRLKEINCLFVQISLDGCSARTHNLIRGANSFKRTIEGIRNAVDAGLTVGIATTVTRLNLKEVPRIIDLSEKMGARIFMHYNFIPTGRGTSITDLDITPMEREKLLKMMAGEIGKRKISLLSTAPQYGRVCEQFSVVSLTHFDNIGQQKGMGESVKFLGEFIGGCGAGRLYCTLDYNGDITPCVFMPIRLGNILDDDFLSIWQNSPVLDDMRSRGNFRGCGSCINRNICGGCRARAYGYFHDVKGCDPGCINNKEDWKLLSLSK